MVSADSNFIMMILTRQHEVSAKVSDLLCFSVNATSLIIHLIVQR